MRTWNRFSKKENMRAAEIAALMALKPDGGGERLTTVGQPRDNQTMSAFLFVVRKRCADLRQGLCQPYINLMG